MEIMLMNTVHILLIIMNLISFMTSLNLSFDGKKPQTYTKVDVIVT